MAGALLEYYRRTLPDDLAVTLSEHIEHLGNANFEAILGSSQFRDLLGHSQDFSTSWRDKSLEEVERGISNGGLGNNEAESVLSRTHLAFIVGLAALGAFVQSNVTGPPLAFYTARLLCSDVASADSKTVHIARQALLDSLRVDGEAAYRLTPNIELLSLARLLLRCSQVIKTVPAAEWAKLRVDFMHQRVLSDSAGTLEKEIYFSISAVDGLLADSPSDIHVSFLLETATIHTHHGHDRLAREALARASGLRQFDYALTGALGKRTKFQRNETSQLVVLAASGHNQNSGEETGETPNVPRKITSRPKALDLNDDTLLESISFTKKETGSNPQIQEEGCLPPRLAALDPAKQPQLDRLDSVILLSLASSITNNNPADGLTREETLPYVTRVLDDQSSNWQIYTHALLLRSRIEGYKSRTVERGLLQLQALVDQVIADTTSANEGTGERPSTFLRKASESESAPASQRLLYVFELCSPTRWEIEAELAARWVSLGGLRSALEIYERLQMWAEVALCWAATDRDDSARRVIRKQLFHAADGKGDDDADNETEGWTGPPRHPAPADAPRLYCILGDLDKDPAMYETAWTVSGERYSRAQRSIGRHYYAMKDYAKASLAYTKSLKVRQLDHGTWFALGCALLELEQYKRAVEAFSRALQLDHDDAESWSNMAAALLNMSPGETTSSVREESDASGLSDAEDPEQPEDPQKNIKDALKALKQAARLKRDNYRIWDNLLTVAASLEPPSWTDMLTAQTQIIDLRGPSDGEKCVDIPILSAIVNHVTATAEVGNLSRPGLPKLLIQLIDTKIVPLITASAPLWRLVAKLALWREKPSSALEAHEKAWRAVTSQPGWETGSEGRWNEVVEATLELAGAYESLGPKPRTEGLGAGDGAVVAKDWKFKARSAIRGIKGRGKGSWEGTSGWQRLDDALAGLKEA